MTEPTSSYEGRLIARPDDRVTLSQALLLGLAGDAIDDAVFSLQGVRSTS